MIPPGQALLEDHFERLEVLRHPAEQIDQQGIAEVDVLGLAEVIAEARYLSRRVLSLEDLPGAHQHPALSPGVHDANEDLLRQAELLAPSLNPEEITGLALLPVAAGEESLRQGPSS